MPVGARTGLPVADRFLVCWQGCLPVPGPAAINP